MQNYSRSQRANARSQPLVAVLASLLVIAALLGPSVAHAAAGDPPPVSDLHATFRTTERVVLHWSPSPGASGYRISRDGQVLVTKNGTWFTDTNVVPGTPYRYTVAPLNAAGAATAGNRVHQVTTLRNRPPLPDPVDDLRSPYQGGDRLVLTWSRDPGAAAFLIYRDGVRIYQKDGNWFTDTGLTPGQTYEYTIVAMDRNRRLVGAGNTLSVTTDGPPAPVQDPIQLLAVGDIANCRGKAAEVAAVVDGLPGELLALGDLAYPDGSAENFAQCFDPHFGPLKSRIKPVTGNHEYYTADATPYFDYFGAVAGRRDQGWYSFDRGNWQIIVLNSNCGEVGGCDRNSAQYRWLQAELTSRPGVCRLVAMHHPRWSSYSNYADADFLDDFYQLLYDQGTDIVLTGHSHGYERMHPANPSGARDNSRGIMHFTVGTGGTSLRDFDTALPQSAVRNADTWGVLDLDLLPDSFRYEFKRAAGGSFTDSGTGSC